MPGGLDTPPADLRPPLPDPAADLDRRLAAELERRAAAGLRRQRRRLESAATVTPVIDGRRVLSFASNDYLGLAGHPALVAAMSRAAREHGAGAGASHLVTGHHALHGALEEALARYVGRPRALLFSTGYMANLAIVSALAGRRTPVLQDRLNHASLLDAARLARGPQHRYRHRSPEDLEARLAALEAPALVLTDGIFSMEGTPAPLGPLAAAARRQHATLVVDDAHGLGVIGPDGRGSLAACRLDLAAAPVLMGTLGKAFGTFGAFVAGSATLVDYLLQTARPYAYTTALPPPLAAATLEALAIAEAEPWRREHLAALVARFRQGAGALGLPLGESVHPIQPVLLGDNARAVRIAAALEARGLLVPAIRPPTVPPGTARLRISLSASHTEAQVDQLLEALAEVGA